MKIKKYYSTLLLIGVISCGDAGNTSVEPELVDTIVASQVSNELPSPHSLELDGGSKWMVSKGMRKPLAKISKLVSNFEGSKVVDYQLLGDDIGKQTSKVIKKCDMKGKAHDELHKWLLPFLDLKEALVMTSSPEEGAAILEHIQEELTVFNQFFSITE